MKQLKKHMAGLSVLLASSLLAPAVGSAQATIPADTSLGEPGQVQPGAGVEASEAADPANTLNVHGLVGIDFTTHYISRGLVLEDQDFIAQPYGELGLTLFEAEGGISKVVGFFGIWNSLHDARTDAGALSGGVTTTPIWYEFDWYGGVAIDFAKNFNLNLSYWQFLSPNEGFGTSKNVQAKLAYNDADLWGGGEGGFGGVKPYGLIFIETDGKAGSGSEEGIYMEFGIEPTLLTIGPEGKYPLALSVPVKVGIGFNDFYEDDDLLGFVTGGVKLSVPLSFIPSSYGAWTGYAGVYYYYYGEGVDDFNTLAGDGDDDIVAAGGISMTF